MIEHDYGEDRAIIYFNGDGPVALEDMTESFAALARIYKRNFESSAGETNPKLYVSRLKTGSIEAEIVPMLLLMGAAVPYMDGAIIIRDFTRWVGMHVKAFAGIDPPDSPVGSLTVSHEDAADLKAFLRPISGKYGAQLGVSHARLATKTGDREMIAEYHFDEGAINRASVNIDKHIVVAEEVPELSCVAPEQQKTRNEVLMVWHQTNKEPGKEKGRSGDKAVIASVIDKPLTVYFPKQTNDLKRRMTQDEPFPFSKGYIVDVNIDFVEGEPKLYHILDMHSTIDLEDD